MNTHYQKIVSFATNQDYKAIKDLRYQMLVERMQMDKFFSKYLDKLGGKMDPQTPNTPIWTLYKKKLREYGELQQAISAAEYYIKKSHV